MASRSVENEKAMTTAFRLTAAILTLQLLAASLCEAGPPSPGSVNNSREWKRMATQGLKVVGNARDGDLRRVAVEIERFREALGSLSNGLKLDSPAPTVVVVFRDDSAFTPFKPMARGKRMDNVAGYFSPRADVNYIVLAPSSDREFTYRLIFHEYTHFVINRNLRRVPLWLHEGLAEFYSTFAGSERDGRFIVGRPIDWHMATLHSRTMVPLAKLLDPNALGDLLRDPHSTQLFYAESWALTHYLLVGGGDIRRRQLSTFLAGLNSGQPHDQAFAGAFGADYKALDKELQAYISKFTMSGIQITPSRQAPDSPIEPLAEADALQVQGDLLLRMGQPDAASPYLTKALALDHMHLPSRLSRVRELMAKERWADAVDFASAPDLEASTLFAAQLARADALRAAEKFDRAVEAYRRAIAVQAEAPAAYFGLSIAQMALGSPAAMASFSTCMAQEPTAGWYSGRLYETLRLGLDNYVVSDAVNYVRMSGWQTDSSSYISLAAALTLLRRQEAAQAAQLLDEISSHNEASSWISAIVTFLQGKRAADVFLSKAGKDEGLLTEAHAYIGIKANIDGEREDALKHLTWVKERGKKDYTEYGLTLGELKRIAKAQG
jgi:tetratricopeptide (TPR) repeat protein